MRPLRIMRAMSGLAAGLLLASCAMGPNYQRPDTETVDQFRMAETPPDTPSLANLAWWELLRDQQLQQMIHMALADNQDLRRAVATIEEFQARAYISKSDYLPGVTFSGMHRVTR